MNGEPNYKEYSLQELREALRTIDKVQYAERARRIAAEIDTRDSNVSYRTQLEAKDEKGKDEEEAAKAFKRYTAVLQKYTIVPEIISLLLGAILCTRLLNIWSTEYISLTLTFSYPWMNPEAQINHIAIGLLLWFSSVGLFLGAIGAMFKIRALQYVLAFGWCMLTFGFQLNSLLWWPTPNFDLPFEFSFSLSMIATLNLGFKMNLVSTFLFLWTALLIPEVREAFFDNKPGEANLLS